MSNIDAESQQDEVLLPGPPPNFQNLQLRRQSVRVTRESRQGLKGPLRAARLCLLSVLIPGMLVAIPLYMRFHVYGEQLYPVGMSDMRLLDNRVSTTWCQRQLVRANTTFNAFLLSEQPVVEPEPLRVSMSRQLELEDDMKEYWAFYLLQGSSVTVSTCVRWPGASLVVIRGHKHLHQCAYIGDDSSEELDELERHIEEGGQWPRVTVNDPNQIKMLHEQHSSTGMGTSDESNEPHRMRRVRPGILFHGNQQPLASDEQLRHKEDLEEDVDSIMLQLLQNIGRVKAKVKGKDVTNVEKKPVTSKVTMVAESPRSVNVTKKIVKEELVEKENGSVTSSPPTSGEVFEDVLRRLQGLGDRGRGVLHRLNKQLGEATPIQVDETKQSVDLSTLRQIIQEMLQPNSNDSEKNTTGSGRPTESNVSGNATENNATTTQERRKRSFTWSSANLEELAADEEEEENGAFEEEAQPDGHADHHAIVNETTPNDQSKSEFWSSFSSSEEKLLNCAGLILNLPLTPHSKCKRELSDDDYLSASHVNTLTYKIPRNGYYFFVFSSENEVQTNYIRVKFELEKIVYNVSNPMAACKNSTDQCSLPLDFFSSEKVVLELPVRSNDSLWNEEYIAVSTCEPRTALYLGCVIAVPLFILLFAFQ